MDGRVRVWRRVGKESYANWEFLANLEGPDEVTVRRRLLPPLLSPANRHLLRLGAAGRRD